MNLLQYTACALALAATPALADGHANWATSDATVAFGSVKKGTIGEVHHFEDVSGTVSEGGEVTLTIDLSSVETYIDIRNERMLEHVFASIGSAELSGEVDMDDINELAIGETEVVDFEGAVTLGAVSADVEAEMLVARLAEDRVLVTTADFIMLSTADLGIDAGIDKLKELASLPGITRATPITVRAVFEK